MAKTFRIKDEAVAKRVRKMLEIREEILKDVANYHVLLQKGNDKTGKACWTVSLIPIADCPNCSGCKNNCYDIRNDCIYPDVLFSRARNSAIHKADIERFWTEIKNEVARNDVKELRINVGGDLRYEDFVLIARELAGECEVLFFTKTYDDLNKFIKENIAKFPTNYGFPPNIHPIMSRWIGMECPNPYGVPESHVLWPDGATTAPEYGAYFCKGNCSACFMGHEGCPSLKQGESVVFEAH